MDIWQKTALNLSTCGPIGKIPFAPGTWGSAFACFVAWCIHTILPTNLFTPLLIFLILSSFIIGLLSVGTAEASLSQSDPGCIIIDELCGQWITLLALPFFFETCYSPFIWPIAFILFRCFDICKPLGINRLQNLHGALGVMVDDVLAGFYGLALLLGFALI